MMLATAFFVDLHRECPYGGEINDASRVPGDRSYYLDVRCNLRINMGHLQLHQELSDF